MKHQETDTNKVEFAYDRIKKLIVNFQFRPGEHLQIGDISDQLRISVTPVREALSRLHAEDLIVSIPNRGFFTKSLDVEELRDLYELAFVLLKFGLESTSNTERSRHLGQPFTFASTDSLTQSADRDLRIQALAIEIERLFEAIVALSSNAIMKKIIQNFNDKSHFIRVIDLQIDQHFEDVLRDTRNLVSQIAAHEVPAALANLHHQFERKQACMADLAKNGLAQAYLSPRSSRSVEPLTVHRVRNASR